MVRIFTNNDQEKVSRGTRAENLIKNENWRVMDEYISRRVEHLTEIISAGTVPEIEYGIIVKTSDQVYHECVGELRALKNITPDFQEYIKKKNEIIKKFEK